MMPLPHVLRREDGPETRFDLRLDADHLAFEGHFPGNPILPGVIQVDWAIRLGEEAFGPLGRFQGLQNLKFMDLARPGEELSLFLTFDGAKLTFRYEGQEKRKSSGVVLFGERS
ncbi:MAG: thioester dehydrase [Firmicutes bacterium]|nr:thioester dehydrase [Bacillota bacterium]